MANDYEKLKKQLIEYYQDLLIVQYHDKPKAKAMIKAEMEETLANLLDIQVRDAFDVDTAIGVQLDIIGKWVGVDRIFKGQMFDNKSWFSLTRYNEPTTPLQGGFSRFDNFDTLEGGFLTYDFIVSTRNKINDTDFRMLIKLKIIRNNIKHSPKDIDEAMYKLFADTLYTVWNEMVYNSDAFTVVGSPTITDDGVASGFSASKYINSLLTINSPKFTIKGNFSFGEDLHTFQTVLSVHSSDISRYLIEVRPISDNSLAVCYWNGTGTEVVFYNQSEVPRAVGKTYNFTIEIDGTTAKSTINGITKTISNFVFENITTFYLGVSNWLTNPFKGSIDLKQFSITVDGVKVLSGSKSQPMEMTFYYKKKNYGIVKLGQEKNCFPIPTGVKANFVEVK